MLYRNNLRDSWLAESGVVKRAAIPDPSGYTQSQDHLALCSQSEPVFFLVIQADAYSEPLHIPNRRFNTSSSRLVDVCRRRCEAQSRRSPEQTTVRLHLSCFNIVCLFELPN